LRTDALYLADILEAADAIVEFMGAVQQQTFTVIPALGMAPKCIAGTAAMNCRLRIAD
jgi:uncharacterized protein with HEPN domain